MGNTNAYWQIKGQQKLNSVAMVKNICCSFALALDFLLGFSLCSAGNSNNGSEWSTCNESIIDERVIFVIYVTFFPKSLATIARWNLTALD